MTEQAPLLWSDQRMWAHLHVLWQNKITRDSAYKAAMVDIRDSYEADRAKSAARIAKLEAQLAESRKNERKPMRVIVQPDFKIDLGGDEDE